MAIAGAAPPQSLSAHAVRWPVSEPVRAIAGAAPPPSLSGVVVEDLAPLEHCDCGGGAPAFIERRATRTPRTCSRSCDCGGGAPAFIERASTRRGTRSSRASDCGGGAPAFIERSVPGSIRCGSPAIAGAAPPPSLSDGGLRRDPVQSVLAIAGAAPPPSLSVQDAGWIWARTLGDCGGGAPAFIERRRTPPASSPGAGRLRGRRPRLH